MSEQPPTPPSAKSSATQSEAAEDSLEARIIETIKTIYDPEIPVNIYELGLIYRIAIDEDAGKVEIDMTLTSPACPVAGTLPPEVQTKIEALDGVNEVAVELVWDPPWSKELLSEAAKLTLGLG